MVKQEEEKYYFERFINIYPLISNKKWRKDESPDFYVYLDNNTFLGIEMEEIVQLSNTKKSKLKEIETLQKNIVEKAKLLFLNEKSIHLHVDCYFNKEIYCKKTEIIKIATELKNIIIAETNRINFSQLTIFSIIVSSWLKNYINNIEISYFPEIKASCWHPDYTFMIPCLNYEIIKHFIDKKECLIAEYKKKCNNIWLLMIVKGIRESSTFYLDKKITEKIFRTNFDKIIIFNPLKDEIVDLNIFN